MRADCQGSAQPDRALALLYPDVERARADSARARRRARPHGFRGRASAPRGAHLLASRRPIPGRNAHFSQQSLDIDPGEHILTLVDDTGERVARRFEVLATTRVMTRAPCSMDLTLKHVETDEVTIRLRMGGSGPPLLLLHGFPQTHAMWSKVAPRLAETLHGCLPGPARLRRQQQARVHAPITSRIPSAPWRATSSRS